MSDAPAPRFTRHGTYISVPMEAAARGLGVAVFSSPALAWEALRLRRENQPGALHNAGAPKLHPNGSQLVGGAPADDIADPWMDTDPTTGEIVWELTETGGRGYFPGAPGSIWQDPGTVEYMRICADSHLDSREIRFHNSGRVSHYGFPNPNGRMWVGGILAASLFR